MLSEGRASVKAPGWPAAGRVRVEVGNWITRQMMWLPNGESCGSEPDPDPLVLGFAPSGVGDGGSAMWYGGWSLIVRSIVPLVRGSTVGDPLS
jgi:hypothetical protein